MPPAPMITIGRVRVGRGQLCCNPKVEDFEIGEPDFGFDAFKSSPAELLFHY